MLLVNDTILVVILAGVDEMRTEGALVAERLIDDDEAILIRVLPTLELTRVDRVVPGKVLLGEGKVLVEKLMTEERLSADELLAVEALFDDGILLFSVLYR